MPYESYAYKKDPYGDYLSIYGDRLEKVTYFSKDDRSLFESDVPDATRVLIDLYLDSDEPSIGHTILTFDIEVESGNGLPNVELAENEITSIAGHDSTLDEYFVMVVDPEGLVTKNESNGVPIQIFETEFDMLTDFLMKYEQINPTILTGWATDFFDIPYLYRRLQRVFGKDAGGRLSPIGESYYNKYRKRYFLAGVSSLDYLNLYKKFTFSDEPTYRLDAIAKKELGEGKVEYKGTLDDLYNQDRERFVEYNLADVELVVKLERKLKFIELVRGICHVGHVPYEDYVYSSKYLEGAVLTYLRKKGLVAPNKPERHGAMFASEDKFIGAYVKQPVPGKYDWIYDLDLTSLYPSIIMSLNVSPETKVTKIGRWNGDDFVRGKEREYKVEGEVITTSELRERLEKENLSVSSNGVLYRLDREGCIPAILDEWFKKRKEYQAKSHKYGEQGDVEQHDFYNRRQYIQKVLLNSMYGVLGLPVFRFYDVDNAEAVTTTGQSVIKFTENVINKYYNQRLGTTTDHVIYVDTDSTFLSGIPLVEKFYPEIDLDDTEKMTKAILEISDNVQNYVNGMYDHLCSKAFNLTTHRFDIKREYVARSGLWIAKKRYAQWIIFDKGLPTDKLDIKGIDVVRSSYPKAFQDFLKTTLKRILMGAGKPEIDETISEFRKEMREMPLIDIAKSSSVKLLSKYDTQKTYEFKAKSKVYNRDIDVGPRVKGTPAHVKAALSFNELLHEFRVSTHYSPFRNGDKIKWIYLKENHYGIDGLAFRGYDDPPKIMEFAEEYLDYDKIFERELQNKLEDFYSALGWIMLTNNFAVASKFFDFSGGS